MEDDLVAAGRVARIETIGRHSRRPRPVTVGFVEEPDGSLLVAARSPTTAWAQNLLADPACHVLVEAGRFAAVAEPLGRDDHVRAIRSLILRYGTPSEDLGRGPSFRLRRVFVD
jgi:deazaflavin-dependent oxidoreductase (nitroreductase family)